LETFTISASQWAIFKSKEPIEKTLFEAEMYAFNERLPLSGYIHAEALELEIYQPVTVRLLSFGCQ
jgi:predicted transcriptional regulator YdeE